MPIIFGEHNPRGPFLGTVGSSPIAITPGMPSFGGANDNGALLAEVKRLNDKIERLETDCRRQRGERRSELSIEGSDKVADTVDDTDRHARRARAAEQPSAQSRLAGFIIMPMGWAPLSWRPLSMLVDMTLAATVAQPASGLR
jgi:hypothetical protein